MKTKAEWREEDRCRRGCYATDEEFIEAIQRDAWEQGVKDGHEHQANVVLVGMYGGKMKEPVFPGSLKPEAKLREPNPGDNDSVFEWAYPPKERP